MHVSELAAVLGIVCALIAAGVAIVVAGVAAIKVDFIKKIGRLGSWVDLAKKYPVTEPYTGNWQKWQSGKIGVTYFTNCLSIGTTTKYLYLAVGGPFVSSIMRWDPLQIPWTAIKSIKKDGHKLILNAEQSEIRLSEDAIPQHLIVNIPEEKKW